MKMLNKTKLAELGIQRTIVWTLVWMSTLFVLGCYANTGTVEPIDIGTIENADMDAKGPVDISEGKPAGIPTPETVNVAGRSYLKGTVEACENWLVEDVDPCSIDNVGYSFPGAGSATSVIHRFDPLAQENVLLYEMFGRSYGSVPHVVIRGVLIPGTDRCELSKIGPARFEPTPTPDELEAVRLVVCFSDVAVSEYIYGSGPPKLTLRTGTRDLGLRDYDNMVQLMKDELRVNRHGQEKIYGLAPAYYSAQVYESWRTAIDWPVQQGADGDAFIESGLLWYVEASRGIVRSKTAPHEITIGTPLSPEQQAKLVWSLDEFNRRVHAAFAKFSETTSGKIWGNEHTIRNSRFDSFEVDYPPLMNDIHDLHAHFRDELLAYEDVAATPSVPPPAPGEPHSYPEPPAERPAPTQTPNLETTQ